nr:unnamed protein product [Callosobruchus chinensis]
MYSKESRFANTGQQPSKTYSCLQCSVVFKKKTALDEHCIKKHTDSITSVSSKIHECTYCNYKTTKKTNMTRHMVKHPSAAASVKITPCKHCTMTFNSKYDLDDHIVRKHQEFIGSVTRKVFECSYCSYKTVRTNKSEKHILSHRRKVGLNQTPIKEEQTTDST